MNETAQSTIYCTCCGDPIKFEHPHELWNEPKMGYVCQPCKYRLKIAVAFLVHNGMKTCEHQEERGNP